jgi:ABC-type transport system involved in multi-copper enzyme maturation permease subunit
MALQAGETTTAANIAGGFVQGILQTWSVAGICLGFCLGAIGLSSEVASKTLVNVLSRPVGRATYLIGRWIGILVFLSVFQLAGIVLALVIASIFDVQFAPTLWLGFAQMFVDAAFFSGVSLGLSVVLPPVLAGAGTVILSALPSTVESAIEHPRWILRLLTTAAYYISPAVMPGDLIAESFSRELLSPDYALYFRVLVENLLYAIAVFILACAVFARREIRFR